MDEQKVKRYTDPLQPPTPFRVLGSILQSGRKMIRGAINPVPTTEELEEERQQSLLPDEAQAIKRRTAIEYGAIPIGEDSYVDVTGFVGALENVGKNVARKLFIKKGAPISDQYIEIFRGQKGDKLIMEGKSAGIGRPFSKERIIAEAYGHNGNVIEGFINKNDVLQYNELDVSTQKYAKSIIDENIDRVVREWDENNFQPFEDLVLELGEIARIKNKKAIDLESFGVPSEREVRILSLDAVKTKSQLADAQNKTNQSGQAFGQTTIGTATIGAAAGTGVALGSIGNEYEYTRAEEKPIPVEGDWQGTNYDPLDPNQNRPNTTKEDLGKGAAGVKIDDSMVAVPRTKDGKTAMLRLGTVIFIPSLGKKFLVADLTSSRFNGQKKIDFATTGTTTEISTEHNQIFNDIVIIREGKGYGDVREYVKSGEWEKEKNKGSVPSIYSKYTQPLNQ